MCFFLCKYRPATKKQLSLLLTCIPAGMSHLRLLKEQAGQNASFQTASSGRWPLQTHTYMPQGSLFQFCFSLFRVFSSYSCQHEKEEVGTGPVSSKSSLIQTGNQGQHDEMGWNMPFWCMSATEKQSKGGRPIGLWTSTISIRRMSYLTQHLPCSLTSLPIRSLPQTPQLISFNAFVLILSSASP